VFLEFYESLCFELVSDDKRDAGYLCTEFPVHGETTTSDVSFRVKLVKRFDEQRGTFIDNRKLCLYNSTLYRTRDSCLFKNQFCLNLESEIPLLRIPGNIISQRYMLLRMIYPLIRYFLLRKNALLVKASCTSCDKLSTIYIGWSGAGKTTSVLNDLRAGRKYISDTMSIITTRGTVMPLGNRLHVFWRNRNALLKFIGTLENGRAKVLGSLFLKQLLRLSTLKRKNLSTIVDIPKNKTETDKTQLSKIIVLNGNNYIEHTNYAKDHLANIIYSINHHDCSEFNGLLDVLSFLGFDVFADYWETYRNKIGQLVDNIY
jgi:hypothetical protein